MACGQIAHTRPAPANWAPPNYFAAAEMLLSPLTSPSTLISHGMTRPPPPDDRDMAEDAAAAWADLPEPERLPVRTMLEELEGVNVLAPLVRCSKRESGSRALLTTVPFRHLVSLYETHVSLSGTTET